MDEIVRDIFRNALLDYMSAFDILEENRKWEFKGMIAAHSIILSGIGVIDKYISDYILSIEEPLSLLEAESILNSI